MHFGIGKSRDVTRRDMSRLSDCMTRHSRHDAVDTLITTRATRTPRRAYRIVSKRDVTSEVEFGLYAALFGTAISA